jgi:D-glycero-D-manno-heptose 1,7-bisphosphate phosphatase
LKNALKGSGFGNEARGGFWESFCELILDCLRFILIKIKSLQLVLEIKIDSMPKKCVFLDRDGVLNEEIGRYVWEVCDFVVRPGIIEILKDLKRKGYLLIVVTNQGGIGRGTYSHQHVKTCHEHFQKECGNLIDAFYYSPYQKDISASLSSKPGTLMFEKAIAKFDIDVASSWMIGDKARDIIPAKKLGIKTIRLITEEEKEEERIADFTIDNLNEIQALIK